jgi:hypothetical protein
LLFGKAVKLNKFSTKFEDDNLLLNIDGVKCKLPYTIKKRSSVKQKSGIAVLAGGEIGAIHKYTCCKSKFAISKTKRDFISYDTNQTIWIIISILNKKGNKMHIYFVVFI